MRALKMLLFSRLLAFHSWRRKRESNPQPCYRHHFRGGWINQFCHFLHLLVGVVRFELTTCTLSECRANQLRHTPIELLVLKCFSDVGYYIKMAPLRGTEESSAAISCSPGFAIHIPIAHALSAFANYNPVCGIDEIFTRVSSLQDFLIAG